MTGGAFTAPTSGERAQRVRDWLARSPATEQLQEVFKELSSRDKGAARLVREKLDEARRARDQAAIAAEWEQKAQALLDQPRMNIADALAWQRDAAKAGAPLSREPLASLRQRLAERIKGIEDLQHRVQVHREAAVLLVQRFDVLSTKGWQDAQATGDALASDVAAWKEQATEIASDANWESLDPRLAPQLEASRAQLTAVSEAFQAALAQAVAAAADASAPLPPVPVWADELRVARGLAPEAAATEAAERPAAPRAPKVDPAVRAAAQEAVTAALERLKKETAEGHGKGTASASAALRAVLKEHGRLVEQPLEGEVHAALIAAGELEGWQRWSADKIREELVAKAEALLKRPEGQALGGRKMQESLRALREQWKKTDQGGVPNHALWKRFDEACNEAHKVVEAWLEKVRADAAEHKALRLALIEELKTWAAAHAQSTDYKALNRALHQFADRWREAGHVGEKVFAELQGQWVEAIGAARAPLEAAQKGSIERRQAMIAEATELGAAPQLRIDAVRALQQRWQAEAQGVPLDRRQEQKLWDAFRAPIDEAFNRKSAEREKAAAATSAFDRQVLSAAKALEAANAEGDAQKIRAALAALEAAMRGEGASTKAATPAPAADASAADPAAQPAAANAEVDAAAAASDTEGAAAVEGAEASTESAAEAAAPAPAPAAPRKPVVAVRGDDRPGARKPDAPADARGGRGGDRRDARGPRGNDRSDRGDRGVRGGDRFGDRDRSPRPAVDRPRLGDSAFRAQRDAMDHAQAALRKLAAQAHGEAVTQLMGAWQHRDVSQLPSLQELGRAVSPAVRGEWSQSVGTPAKAGDSAAESLLRLELAAEVPTPAEQLNDRRALQLKLLTRRGDPSPQQTWAKDVAKVLESAHDEGSARRLQSALKALLRR
nr:DUF349 domain-containing protein [Variovorax dokdonensis]